MVSLKLVAAATPEFVSRCGGRVSARSAPSDRRQKAANAAAQIFNVVDAGATSPIDPLADAGAPYVPRRAAPRRPSSPPNAHLCDCACLERRINSE